MQISVAMATYNGSRYLREQLDSLAEQTRLPDELVVCDDRSTDDTLQVLERFARSAPFPVRVTRNARNLGYRANFTRALELCEGELIFMSDQDDVWKPRKIELVAAVFGSPRAPLVVVNNQLLTDEALHPSGVTTLDAIRRDGKRDHEFVHGCCTAFRSSIKPLALQRPDIAAHDDWVHLIGRLLDRRLVLSEVHQLYRRHGGVTTASSYNSASAGARPFVGVRRTIDENQRVLGNLLKREAALASFLDALERTDLPGLTAALLWSATARARAELASIQARRRNITNGSRSGIFYAYLRGQYRIFNGAKTAARDFLSSGRVVS